MEQVKIFFDFEIQNRLFDIVDQYGLKPWEAVRYEVMNSVLYKKNSYIAKFEKSPFYTRIFNAIGKLIKFSIYLHTHKNRDNLFVLCSRDKKDGQFYDKISDGLYTLADKSTCFTLDTIETYCSPDYKYGNDVAPDISRYYAKFSVIKYDYNIIYKLVKDNFPDSSITIDIMNKCYREFVTEYKFYKLILRNCHIKRVFLVQNGIRKGIFAAANEKGVKVIELQHGQISAKHPVYSYPNDPSITESKIYHPDYLLLFGPFWSKYRHYPGVVNYVIGNESYAGDIGNNYTQGNKKLLVISNIEEGALLAKRIEEVLDRDQSFFFFFKLHPNQYMEFEAYKKLFEGKKRIEVVSYQQSVNQLLCQCEGVFLNDSTVELEALSMGKKVFVLKEQNYHTMDYIFGEEGVYACNDIDEFIENYKKSLNVTLAPREDIFCKYDKNVATKMLNV